MEKICECGHMKKQHTWIKPSTEKIHEFRSDCGVCNCKKFKEVTYNKESLLIPREYIKSLMLSVCDCDRHDDVHLEGCAWAEFIINLEHHKAANVPEEWRMNK